MPTVPRVGDSFNLDGMIPEDQVAHLPPSHRNDLYRLHEVDWVSWHKDEQGYYASVRLKKDRE